MNDEFICQQVLAGNTQAYRILVLRHQRPLFRFLMGFKFPEQAVEDLAQEAFVRAYKNLSKYDSSRAAFQTWLFTIARNLALNEIEKQRTRGEPDLGLELDVAAADMTGALETHLDLERALGRIPAAFRTALVLSYVQDLPVEAAASIEGCSIGTIKSRVFRAKALLRSLMNDEKEKG